MANTHTKLTDHLVALGLTGLEAVVDADNKTLAKATVDCGRGRLSSAGSVVVETGKFTGRAAQDKYVVKSPTTEKNVWWENNINTMTPDTFQKLKTHITNYLKEQGKLYITERSVGADETHNLAVRVFTPSPSHALFSNHVFRDRMRDFNSTRDYTILHAPDIEVDPKEFGTKSGTVIATCFDTKTTIIIGTQYSGEIKKSMFSVLNYKLPEHKVLPMHAGANKDDKDISVFFGLSGTGKTTLSTDQGKSLVGDDEHGLSDAGVFNFEGGCYAKTIRLSKEAEPDIYDACHREGALLENVVLKADGSFDFDDASLSENGRCSYPLSFIDGIEPTSRAGVPKNIFFLTADAFGVLPPVAKLTRDQAMFYFVLGYTAKVAGTEVGVKEPQATFSPCFGAPFMLRHPSEYAELLAHYLDKYGIQVWLINTGWAAGPYGVGERYPIKVTREIIRTIQAGKASGITTEKDPYFGLNIPTALGALTSDVLAPQKSWRDAREYTTNAKNLAASFHKQMEKFGDFYNTVKAAAPTFKGETKGRSSADASV